jgi:hypothetical protein
MLYRRRMCMPHFLGRFRQRTQWIATNVATNVATNAYLVATNVCNVFFSTREINRLKLECNRLASAFAIRKIKHRALKRARKALKRENSRLKLENTILKRKYDRLKQDVTQRVLNAEQRTFDKTVKGLQPFFSSTALV